MTLGLVVVGLSVVLAVVFHRWRGAQASLSTLRSRVLTNLISPAYLSHEIRTPLTVIHSCAELLADEGVTGTLNSNQRSFVDTIVTNAATTVTLAEDYLDLFTLERSLASLRLHRSELREVMREAVQEFRLMRPSDTRLDNRGAPIYVDADERLLKQAVWNLLANAVRHGGSDVFIDVRVSAQDGIALIQIEDNGRGMVPAGRVECAFEATSVQLLSRLELGVSEPVLTVPHAGSGIGMNVVSRIVRAHRGRLLLDSTVGKGTRILIQIPTWGSELDLSTAQGAAGV